MQESEYDKYVILRYLDNPVRILFWTIDEMLIVFAPIAIGFISGFPGISLIIATLGYLGLRYIKTHFGNGLLRHAIYWYLPFTETSLQVKVKSYIREYIG